jgi:hypothetical protein
VSSESAPVPDFGALFPTRSDAKPEKLSYEFNVISRAKLSFG